ncbi:MAG: hypothetical protein ISS92_02700 [Candidatus Omnitrophica bacterium]|nr:hypothetical protein [Candidatus Omnitrophota bacterium]
MRNVAKILLPVVFLSLALTGCGGGVNENKPIAQVKTEAQGMSLDQLKATISKYQAVIQSKRNQMTKLTTAFQKIPVTQMMGDEAKKLKGDIQNVMTSIRALSERLNIYAQELRRKM